MFDRKGIILAGGSGTRLYPLTLAVSKQLMPVYDKPMIYYPLSILMLAGIREILVITTPDDQDQFKRLLGDGEAWGLKIQYAVQEHPNGLAEAYLIAEDFLAGAPSALILGDNIFHGYGLTEMLRNAARQMSGGSVFGYHVADPRRYGVASFSDDGTLTSIVEKPDKPPSSYAVTGLYFLDGTASERAKAVRPSKRGELEIVEVLTSYISEGSLLMTKLGRGHTWLDTGTHDSLNDASNYVRTIQKSQGVRVCSPDEIAFQSGWISEKQMSRNIELLSKTDYGQYLKSLL
ncbi:glucose-1-phosphate thymidylyltransferase RfbA [Roseobacter sp. HKCCD5988]|uniref:glucose-1-phosphate thymidylyltransferase RfbA n=1 Tax=Roseobacter sp. HKCCD5988 TaxID=3120338 RepID=UPI0030EE0361